MVTRFWTLESVSHVEESDKVHHLTHFRVRLLPQAEDFPECHPIRPDVRLLGKFQPHQRLEGAPFHAKPNLDTKKII